LTTLALPRFSPRARWLALGAAGLGAWVALAVWIPPDDPSATLCLFHRVTGIGCASCGLTRALALLARGQWGAAFALHPLAPALALEAAGAWLVGLAVIERRMRAPSLRRLGAWLIANAVALLAIWVIRLATGTLPR